MPTLPWSLAPWGDATASLAREASKIEALDRRGVGERALAIEVARTWAKTALRDIAGVPCVVDPAAPPGTIRFVADTGHGGSCLCWRCLLRYQLLFTQRRT